METRLSFGKADLSYLANLCHNCGECLYACPYSAPHVFDINVPRTLAEIRLRSYQEYCWPQVLGAAFTRSGLVTSLSLAAGLATVMGVSTAMTNPGALWRSHPPGDFYGVVPHGVMVVLFGGAFAFVFAALGIGVARFWRDVNRRPVQSSPSRDSVLRWLGVSSAGLGTAAHGIRDALTLRHLHPEGVDCVSAEERRWPWRRWWHHCTSYGFMLCGASTVVAAIYHAAGWPAPYGYTSLPVFLGTIGGAGLLVGPAGLLILRGRRDEALADPAQDGLDESFIVLLLLTSLTGLLLLVARTSAVMPALLLVHLGIVLALVLTLPYGKFVHGLYRVAALVKHASDRNRTADR
jgi:citrate/tricarballylate utilization protein